MVSHVNAQCCSGPSTCNMGAAVERPSRASARVERLLDKEGGREALVRAAMADERFVADLVDAIGQDPDLRDRASRLVTEEPVVPKDAGASSQGIDRRLHRAAEQLVRDERHREEVIDALLANEGFTTTWILAVGSDSRWRKEGLQAWGPRDQGPRVDRHERRSNRDAVHYTCPMHPEVISDRPGQCPKCGMDLVRAAS
jgi:hypothetical protein